MPGRLRRHLAAARYGMIWRKPRFLARMVRFYIRSSISPETPPLRYVDFAVDYACNLRCEHCFKTTLEANPHRPRLAWSMYPDIARQCLELGAIHLSLQGGEVTLLDNLESLIRGMSPHRALFSLTTNGTRITPALASGLRAWGVDQLNISIDSFIPEEHDRFRGVKGAWSSTFAGLRHAEAAGLSVQVNTTVSRFNLYSRGFRMLVDHCIDRRILLNLVLAAPSGNWSSNRAATLEPEDVRCVRALVRSTPYVRQDMDSVSLGRGCPAMKEAIYITPFGDVLCCPFIHVSFGSLHSEPLREIIARALRYPFLKAHAPQCLVAEERVFMDRYLPRISGQAESPAGCEGVFGPPEAMAEEYPLPQAVAVSPSEVSSLVSAWRRRCDGLP